MKTIALLIMASAIGCQLGVAQVTTSKSDEVVAAARTATNADSTTNVVSSAAHEKREGAHQIPENQPQRAVVDQRQLRISFQERFRIESTDNATTMASSANGGSSYSRYRSLLTVQYVPVEELETTVKLGNEFRYYFAPTNKGFSSNEFFFDQLYAKWNLQSMVPAMVTVGRQNMVLGEGFLVADGTSLDGSRTTYFDAIRADVAVAPQHLLTLFYSFVPRMDRVLPRVHDQAQLLDDGGEGGAGVYYTGDLGTTNLQAYLLHKENYTSIDRPVRSHINAAGGRIKLPLVAGLSFTGEGAYEFGLYGNEKWTGLGGYSYVDYKTGGSGAVPSMVSLKAVYLSGDKPGTTAREGWDPMWGRTPKWNDLYYYSFTKESGVGYWTNYLSIGPSLSFAFSKEVNGIFGFYNLSAPQAPLAAKFPGGTGKNRGNLFSARIYYTLNETFTGHVVWERLQPGSFFFKDASVATWMRIELIANI